MTMQSLHEQAVAACHGIDLTPTLPPLTVAESAPVLNVSTDTVYESIGRGEIRALRLGRAIRIPRSEIARLLGMTADPSQAGATQGDASA